MTRQQVTSKGTAFIASHEGFVGRWYADPVGIGTIGHGFTWASDAFRQWWKQNRPGQRFEKGAVMSRVEAAEVLQLLLDQEYGPAVTKAWGRVASHVFDGGTSNVFNVGARSLGWRWSKAIQRGDIRTGAKLLRTTAVTARGKKLRGLLRRRKEEADLILHAIYPVGHTATNDTTLRRRSRGPRVAQFIKDLTKLGYYDGVQDDLFGRGTEAAVVEFQRAEGLHVDGIAGPVTLARIKARLDGVTSEKPTPSRAPVWTRIITSIINAISKMGS